MKIKHLIEKLKRENPEEEAVFILEDNRSEYFVLVPLPFLHAGPKKFAGKHGDDYTTSVVMIRATKYRP
jgi:hypothetical protein